jgi:hypothetical protein
MGPVFWFDDFWIKSACISILLVLCAVVSKGQGLVE